MRKIVAEVEGEGLEALLGATVQVWCVNYIYTGTLIGVNEKDILLGNARVVYETGPLNADKWTDAQVHAEELYIRTAAIESYCRTTKK
jgi:hypothetical protein